MKKVSFLLVILMHLNSTPDYQKIFGNDYADALSYFKKNQSTITTYFKYHSIDQKLIIPVIFPERIRYSMIKDFLETAAVELIYIDLGTDYVDFSIGDFQIKPSFAEKVEQYLTKTSNLRHKYKLIVDYGNKQNSQQRKERVRRLKLLNYQLIYISAFYDIVNQKFNLGNKPDTEKIKFLASAYNHGFDSNASEIEKYVDDEYFPYGTKYKGKQYAYAEVAVDFYLNHYQSLFK
jgi:hypothetical protein